MKISENILDIYNRDRKDLSEAKVPVNLLKGFKNLSHHL